MKRTRYFALILITCFTIFFNAFAAPSLNTNSIELRVINSLREDAYFSVCTRAISANKKTICSDIQPIQKGSNRIFIPPYSLAYPVITGFDEKPYTCGTEAAPAQQLSFTSQAIRNNTLILDSYLLDKSNNRLAILCVLQQDQQGMMS